MVAYSGHKIPGFHMLWRAPKKGCRWTQPLPCAVLCMCELHVRPSPDSHRESNRGCRLWLWVKGIVSNHLRMKSRGHPSTDGPRYSGSSNPTQAQEKRLQEGAVVRSSPWALMVRRNEKEAATQPSEPCPPPQRPSGWERAQTSPRARSPPRHSRSLQTGPP